MTLDEITSDEKVRFGKMIGSTIHAYTRVDDIGIDETLIPVDSFITEEELVTNENFEYMRLPLRDHTWPAEEEIDTFIRFVQSIDPDCVWLHFHCHTGKGRTGIMMMIYDMMMNPDVPMQDIAVRQTMLGGSYPLYTEDSDYYKAPLYNEKARLTLLIYEYTQEQHDLNYQISWSQWLFKHRDSAQ